MPRPTTPLPTADDFYDRLDRPVWHPMSSAELAVAIPCHPNTVWNWKLRGNGPAYESDRLVVRASNRVFYLPCLVLAWLSSKEGTSIPAWIWARRWLVDRHGLRPETRGYDDPAWIASAVTSVEQCRPAP